MAYTELDRDRIRHYVGYGAIFLQAEPRLENAILATQAQTEGGARPDSTTENGIKALIYGSNAQAGVLVTLGGTSQTATTFAIPPTRGLMYIEMVAIPNLWDLAFIHQADQGDAIIDPYRGMVQLRSEGRRLCHAMARMLGMRGVRADVFSPGQIIIDDDPFSYSDLHHWRRGP